MATEITITGIIANLSTSDMCNAGIAMTNLWTYPDTAKDVIPLPLTRLTSFTIETSTGDMSVYKKAIVTAKVSHMAYGVMKAVVIGIIEIMDE